MTDAYIILFALLVLAALAIDSRRKSASQARAHYETESTWQKRMSSSTGNSIFVVLPAYRNTSAAQCILRIFDTAHNPYAVTIGIMEHDAKRAQPDSVVDRYRRLAHNTAAIGLLPNIRELRETPFNAYGASVARQTIVRQLYSGEKYVLFAGCNSVFLSGWDTVLLESLAKAKTLGGHVVSCFPSEWSPGVSEQPLPATFPAFVRFDNNLPVFRGKPYALPKTPPLRTALASMRCLFGEASLLLTKASVHEPSLPFLRSAEADYLVSVQLWSRGYNVYTPLSAPLVWYQTERHVLDDVKQLPRTNALCSARDTVVGYFVGTNEGPFPKNAVEYALITRFQENSTLTPREFEKYLGVDCGKKYAAGRLLLGLQDDYTDVEIQLKYGSKANFEQHKAMYCID